MIRRLRQDEAAKVIGVCEATYLNWEKDQRRPAAHHLPAVIRFLGTDPNPKPQNLGERMAAKRRAMGWSIQRAASAVGMDDSTWRNIENGRQVPKGRVLRAIELALCVAT